MSGRSRPLYARLLRLRHLRLRAWVSFVLFEGAAGIGALLALADIVIFWAVVAIPLAVAAMVKLHDLVAGALKAGPIVLVDREAVVRGVASVPAVAGPAGALERQRVAVASLSPRPDGPRPDGLSPRPDGFSPRPDGGDRRSRGNKGRFGL